jgi:hypothetical protein
MGKILKTLSWSNLSAQSIFPQRFVIEFCEKIHIHYRNLRLLLSLDDWLEICQGFITSYERWKKLGNPIPDKTSHIELCRRKVGQNVQNEGIQINLNLNLYNQNKDKIYAEGANFEAEKYIHLKIRDIRLEMPISEFMELANNVAEAKRSIENSHITASV